MKQFIKNVLLFTITCLLLALIIIFIENRIINLQGRFKLANNEKYLFLGHSHAQMAYDDRLIDSSVNQASSGEAYFYTYIKLNKLLESNREIKTVFIEYSNNSISTEMDGWIWDDIHILDRYKVFTAYTHLDELKVLGSKNLKATLQCSLKSIVNNIYYILHPVNITKDSMMGGYIYLVRDKTDSILQAHSKNPATLVSDTNISVLNIDYLQKIIEVCRQKGISVYLIRSPLHPQYPGFSNELKFRNLLKTRLAGAEFLDFKDYPLKNSEYGDLEHVNFRGAKKYSLFFNRLLKEGLLDKPDKQNFINEQMAVEREWEK